MYRCCACRKSTPPKTPRKVHTVYRDVPYTGLDRHGRVTVYYRKEIERELPVCGSCHAAIRDGVEWRELFKPSSSSQETSRLVVSSGKIMVGKSILKK